MIYDRVLLRDAEERVTDQTAWLPSTSTAAQDLLFGVSLGVSMNAPFPIVNLIWAWDIGGLCMKCQLMETV